MIRDTKYDFINSLRRRAELNLAKLTETPAADPQSSVNDLKSILHELSVYEEELLLQNEDLRKSEAFLTESRKKYHDLYHSTPAGFVTLDSKGQVLEINHTLEDHLELEYGAILGKDFYHYVRKEDRDLLYLHLKRVFQSDSVIQQSLRLISRGGKSMFVLLESRSNDPGDSGSASCRIAMIDISAQMKAEQALEKRNQEIRNLLDAEELVIENERLRISGYLHDELGQLVTALNFDLRAIEKASTNGNEIVKKRINSSIEITGRILKTIQTISQSLRPAALDMLGLVPALKAHVQDFETNTKIPVNLDLPEEPTPFSKDLDIVLFRIIQEGLTNVARHAEATRVQISIKVAQNSILLELGDNGNGVSSENLTSNRSLGLTGIRERARQQGGEAIITDSAKGTIIRVRFPRTDP